MKRLCTLLMLAFTCTAMAQPPCPDGTQSLLVNIQTDNWGYETSWSVSDAEGTIYYEIPINTYAANSLFQTQVCIPDDACITFHIEDSYGDGITGEGFYMLVLEGDTLNIESNFGDEDFYFLGCAAGQTCTTPDTAVVDSIYTTLFDDSWYIFTPDSVGIYEISTCGLSNCDTKIWIYDTCDGNGFAEDNEGTLFYDDNQTDCAPQAVISSFFSPYEVYYIRIGDSEDACADSVQTQFQISYQGPVSGCTDPLSCNYNPLATVDDGSCIPQGDPDCPDAPDLLMRQDVLATSIYLSSMFADDECLIEEGCMNGYGMRDIIRFSTRIDNIGELDYYIGQPSNDNTQFTWNNCHNHFHYDGYAEYVLFDENGTEIPIGFKNGFCVLDLGCTSGNAQYGCGNMGISAGCYDEYWSALECQWIDITDIEDGTYTFVTRVNWDNAPDKLGRVEKDSLNNWAQVCVTLDRSSGSLQMSVDPDCPQYIDCEGTPYGPAQPDCEGVCNGTAIRGDLDINGIQEMIDAQMYITSILANDIAPTNCNDLSGDGYISVYDAALLASCLNYGTDHEHEGEGFHDHCKFPSGVFNSLDTVSLSILEANFEENWIDIGIKNPSAFVNAYQFQITGLMVSEVENLVDETNYPITPYNNIDESMIIGISYEDMMIEKSETYHPLCRIHFAQITNDSICLTQIVDIVNQNHETVETKIDSSCIFFMPNGNEEIFEKQAINVIPNPFSNSTMIQFTNPQNLIHQLYIMDASGRVLKEYPNIKGDQIKVERGNLPPGIYFYQLSNIEQSFIGKLAIQKQ